MSQFPIWAAVAIALCALLMIRLPAFAAADPRAGNGGGARVAALDGLRGFLAFGVFLHHAAIYRGWMRDHIWTLPPSHFYGLVGQVGVAFFFINTGFLFWSGASLFGLLTSRGAQRLGAVSYDIYLLQGLTLALVFASPAMRSFALHSSEQY